MNLIKRPTEDLIIPVHELKQKTVGSTEDLKLEQNYHQEEEHGAHFGHYQQTGNMETGH